MLLQRDAQSLIERLWARLGCEVELPEPVEAYLAPKGPLSLGYVDNRRHRRFHYRQKAILTRNGVHSAVYTKNISRSGLAFLAPTQLLPLERIVLALATGDRVGLIVRRCRRLRERCYECGAEVVDVTHELDRQMLGLISALSKESSDPG